MPSYSIIGVNKESGDDVNLTIDAQTPENARAKAELKNVAVTKVIAQSQGLNRRIVPEATTTEGKVAMGVGRAVFWIIAGFVILMLFFAIVNN